MLPLAIVGLPLAVIDAIAARVRGATICPSAKTADAVLMLGDAVDMSMMESHLREGKAVAITPAAELLDHPRLRILNPDRYLPSRRLIRQQLDAGNLGQPGLLRMHCWEPTSKSRASLLRNLDLALWYFGKTPNLIYAVASAGLHVHLGFADGGMALLDFVHDLPAPDSYHAVSLIGSNGAAYADDHANMQLVYGNNAIQAARTGEGVLALAALVQDYVNTIAAAGNVATWREVLTVADAVHQSAATKQAVTLKGDA